MSVDWRAMFVPEHSLIEIFVRGTFMYIVLFSILRFFMKRQSGVIGIADLLVIVLIADAAQNAMSSEYKSITEGTVLVLTIVFWNFALDWLGYHFRFFQKFTRPPPLPLIDNGRLLRRNMRQEMITTEELMSQLRQQGIEDPAKVKRAYIEGDGRISIICHDGENAGGMTNDPRELT
ncbi:MULTISPECIES: DUF421 domain-containing protein [Microvirga]|uniref:DUF421 domain-containing protein n=1 Tax=Microvirga TaxID=186650 RepID=UPI001CFF35FF|nr:YetF domain-containing protein [Microvirga lenta]MCB5174593.1 DUF421 domain-containing protein [Microvirga lenta]